MVVWEKQPAEEDNRSFFTVAVIYGLENYGYLSLTVF
jgi:hypothetical protein